MVLHTFSRFVRARGAGVPVPRKCRATRRGYTLIELMFVVFIITLMLTIAMPRLFPAMLSSQLEGSARHIANYGRSAVAYSVLNHEPITVRFDLDKGEYYCLKWPDSYFDVDAGMEAAGLSGIEGKNDMGLSREANKKADGLSTGENTDLSIRDLMSTGTAADLESQGDAVRYELDRVFQRSLMAQANNVPHEDLQGKTVDPMFEKDFKLSLKDGEEQREEVQDSLLGHGHLPGEIAIESILLGGEEISEGTVDIDVTPLGLSQSVSFFLKSDKGEYYTVKWDPITGGAHLVRGKEMASAGPVL